MKKYLIPAVLVSLFFVTKLFSQVTPNPIDVYLDSCMEKNPSTMGMVKCTEDAAKMWDNELNKYYKLLMSVLDEASALKLKESERVWVDFQEKENANIDGLYSRFDGTMYIPMNAYSKLEIIRARALQLKDYFELLTGDN